MRPVVGPSLLRHVDAVRSQGTIQRSMVIGLEVSVDDGQVAAELAHLRMVVGSIRDACDDALNRLAALGDLPGQTPVEVQENLPGIDI